MLTLLERHSLQTKRNSNNLAKLRIGEIVIIKDDKSRLIFKSSDGEVCGAELIVFQPKTKKTCVRNRTIPHLIPSEVSDNFEEEKENELAKEDVRHPRRVAVQNADLMKHL